jgi:pyruvate dehydrogenase E1 component alpha subunit
MPITRKGKGQPKAGAKSSLADVSTPSGKFSLISDKKLIGLYTNLLKCRDLNRELNGPSNGNGGSTLGREAALVGTSIDLGSGDMVWSLERGLLTALSRESALETLLVNSVHHGSNGLSTGKNSAIGSSAAAFSFTHVAIGTALANKTARNGKIAVVYSGEAHSGALRETIHIAAVHALPIIFVQHLDGGSPRPRADAPTRRRKIAAGATPWFPIITVDTHDVVAVYRVAFEAISRARSGQGPIVIECQPFPVNAKAGFRNGRHADDPVQNMEHYLRTKGLFDPKLKGYGPTE